MTESRPEPPALSARDALWTRDGKVGVSIFVVSVLSQLAIFDRSIVPMDEGHLAALAMALQDGKLLYRDLHTGIFPGVYHVTALLFGLFGSDLIVTRCAEVAVNASIASCLWLAGARMMPRAWALVAPLLYLAVIPVSFPVLAMFNYSSLALALAMTSLYLLVRYQDACERSVAVALGATLALGVFCKQNFGAFAFIALLASLLLNRADSALARRSWRSILSPIAGSGIAVTLAFASYFVFTGTWVDFIHATLIQIGGDQLASFNNPIPPIVGSHPAADSRFTFLYSPPYLFNKMIHGEAFLGSPIDAGFRSVAIRLSYGIPIATLIGGPLLWFIGVRNESARVRRGIRTGTTFALVFFLGIFPSAIWSHLAYVLAPVLLLLGLIASRCDDFLSRKSDVAAGCLRAVVATLVGCALATGALASLDIARWHKTELDLPRASVRVSAGQEEIYRDAVRFAQECAAPDESIFVAPSMPIVYFLADRSNVSRYDLTIPGDVDGRRIVDALESARTRCVIYNPVMYPEFEPFATLFPELNTYLRQRYRSVRRIRGGGETWLGMMRRDREDELRAE